MEGTTGTSRDRPVLLFLGALYCALVWLSLGMTPLWLDEIQQLDSERQRTIQQIVDWAKLNPAGVPLPYLVQQAVIRLFGFSTLIARTPAAVCSVLGGIVFALIAHRMKIRRVVWPVVLFLAAPLQFRYALEARGYSQALLFSVLSLMIFLYLSQRPSIGAAILYALAIGLGLYSQPFTIFPVAGQLIWLLRSSANRAARRYALVAAGAACLSFVPWYVAESVAKHRYPQMAVYFFSWRQVAPWTVLHDFPGGGYIASAALFSLGIYGLLSRSAENSRERLLTWMAAISILAPIAADVAGSYFFAERQLLFALAPVLLLGGLGLDRLFEERRRALAFAALAAFLIPAAWKDYRDARVPKDDLSATADRIEAEVTPGACVLVAPRLQIAYYRFFHPDLGVRACPENPDSQIILAVDPGPRTSSADRAEIASLPARGYQPERSISVGRARITIFGSRRKLE